MIDVPAACAAAAEWYGAASALRKELGREPEENEVRAKLGWPSVVGSVEFQYTDANGFISTSAAIPGTRFRISVERQNEGPLKVTLLEKVLMEPLQKDTGHGPAVNTDREIWRERPDDYYADSIHVTKEGAIGINCGGTVIVMPVRGWHALALAASRDLIREEKR